MDNENVLVLTDRELATLGIILRFIGGDPDETIRGYADSIYKKTKEANPQIAKNIISYDKNLHSNYKGGLRDVLQEGASSLYLSRKSRDVLDKVVAQDEIVVNGVTYRRV